ncbi:MAG: hypothetical protein IKP95_11395 [Ruminococcus sp.]|nr:hypothetical protein [Ruminococcus sp.]
MQGIKNRSLALLTAFILVLSLFTLLPQGTFFTVSAEADYVDAYGNTWSYSAEDGSSIYYPGEVKIKPSKIKKGDVNRDGTVDLSDYSDLAKYFSEWEGYDKIVNVKAADLNNSGAPDLDDLSILAKCFSEWTDYREKYLS